MKNKIFFCLIIIIVLLTVSGIAYSFVTRGKSLSPSSSSPQPAVGLANPASVYCEEQGGQSQIVTTPDGAQSGDCLFPDGSKCDEWAFFRHECQKGVKSNFSKEGNYLEVEGRPVFLYEEPGHPALSLDLRFAVETICDFGQGAGRCNVHQLKSGDRVLIEGVKNENILTIVKMKKI